VYASESVQRLVEELERILRDPYLSYREGKAALDFVKQQEALASLPDGLPVPPHLVAAVNEREGVLEAARERLQNSIASAYTVGVDSMRSISVEAFSKPSLAESLKRIGDDLERHLSPENLNFRDVAFAQGIHDGLKERALVIPHSAPAAEEVSQLLDRISVTLTQAQKSLPSFEREALVAGIERAREGLEQEFGRFRGIEIE